MPVSGIAAARRIFSGPMCRRACHMRAASAGERRLTSLAAPCHVENAGVAGVGVAATVASAAVVEVLLERVGRTYTRSTYMLTRQWNGIVKPLGKVRFGLLPKDTFTPAS